MIADLKPYQTYKASGLPWLGQVPAHWEMRPAFGAFVPIHERNRGLKEKTVLSLSYGRIIIKPAEKLRGLVPASFETYQIVNPGDIVLRTTDLQNDHTSLRVGMVRHRGIITSAYLALSTSPGVSPRFGFQFLNVWDSSKAIYGYGSGLRQNLDFSHFKRMPVPVPPPAEQDAIVRFLDWANGRLERTISAKLKQLTLVRERVLVETEQALRSAGVVKVRLSTVAQVMSRPIDRQRDQIYTRIGLYNRGRGIFHKPSVPGADLGDSEFFSVWPGDFVISGQFAWEGAVALARAKESGCIASHRYPILRGHDAIASSAFLFSFFRSSYGAMLLDHHSRGAAGRNRPLNAQRLLKEEIPVPTRAAQERIEFLLEQEYEVAQSVQRVVGIIKEYRTRLAADVVTGKLDVREAAARLPDETPVDIQADGADLLAEDEQDEQEAAV
jgi:type I restriction enzyme S subunit